MFRRVAWGLGCRLALFVHGTDVTKAKSWTSRLKTRASLLFSDLILTNSVYTAHLLKGLVPLSKPVVVFHPGLEPGYGSVPGATLPPCPVDGSIRVLSLCRHTERKGLDQGLRAFARLQKKFPQSVYWIAGTGDQTASLVELARSLGLENRVYFWGDVDDQTKFALYRACQVFLMPNRRLADGDVEGFGISFLEANAYGLPVIGGTEGGSAEAISPGTSGWLVDGSNLDAVTQALDQAFEHPEQLRALGETSRTRAIDEFSYPHLVEALVNDLGRAR